MRLSICQTIATLMRSVLAAGLVAVAVGPQDAPAQEVAQTPEARARAFIDLMADGHYAQAFADRVYSARSSADRRALGETAGPSAGGGSCGSGC